VKTPPLSIKCTNTESRSCYVKILEQALVASNVFESKELIAEEPIIIYLYPVEIRPILKKRIKEAKNAHCTRCSFCMVSDYELD
jgi:hypothetical protein